MTAVDHHFPDPPPALRWGVLGCGRVFEKFHLPAIESIAGWSIAVAWDPRGFRLRWLGEHRPGIQLADSAVDVLDHPDVEAILVASPPSHHFAQVAAAIERGLPALVEKPLALAQGPAGATAALGEAYGAKVAVGFTRRFRRPYRQLRDRLNAGDARLLEGNFTLSTPLKFWDAIAPTEPGWDVLSDLGSHQVDLTAWLFGEPVHQVRAWSIAGLPAEREIVRFELTLANGGGIGGEAAHAPRYRERLQLRTSSGWLIADGQAYLRLPAPLAGFADLAVGTRRLFQGLTGAPHPTLESFRLQYLAFSDWLSHGERPPDIATLEDGARAAAVIAAMRESIERSGEWMAVRYGQAPSQPPGVVPLTDPDFQEETEAVSSAEADHVNNQPDLSVVLVVGNRRRRGAAALASLLAQPGIEAQEIVLIDANSNPEVGPIPGADHPSVRLERVDTLASFGALRAYGARLARGRLVAFMEEHVVALPGWLSACRAHLATEWSGIGGEMHNGNPGSGISDIIALMNYTAWRPPAEAGSTRFIAGQNNLYRRETLEAYAGDLPALLENESVLNMRMTSAGRRLCIDPAIKFAHRNETSLGLICHGYFHWHRNYGANRVAAEGKGWLWRLLRAGSWPLVPVVRAWRMGRYLQANRKAEVPAFLRWLPVVLLSQAASGLGMAVGILFGPGNSARRFLDHELNVDRPMAAAQVV